MLSRTASMGILRPLPHPTLLLIWLLGCPGDRQCHWGSMSQLPRWMRQSSRSKSSVVKSPPYPEGVLLKNAACIMSN